MIESQSCFRSSGGLPQGGSGRMLAGLESHARARSWDVTAPDGRRWRVRNFRAWARRNAELFEAPELGKTPVWLCAVAALSFKGRWRGWFAERVYSKRV